VSPVKYELRFYTPEDGILHSHRRENLSSYIKSTGGALQRGHNISPMRHELGPYIPENGIFHSHRMFLKARTVFGIHSIAWDREAQSLQAKNTFDSLG
jgi:hypothetical protein